MASSAFDDCPRCGKPLQRGFAHRAAGLSFVAPQELDQFLSHDEDLLGAGLARLLPSVARYLRSYLCRACQVYIVDYGVQLSREEAREAAKAFAPPPERAMPRNLQ
jgi:hypothetical protein